jgi:hypothetical protein
LKFILKPNNAFYWSSELHLNLSCRQDHIEATLIYIIFKLKLGNESDQKVSRYLLGRVFFTLFFFKQFHLLFFFLSIECFFCFIFSIYPLTFNWFWIDFYNLSQCAFYKVITISDKQLSILLILNFVTVYFFIMSLNKK